MEPRPEPPAEATSQRELAPAEVPGRRDGGTPGAAVGLLVVLALLALLAATATGRTVRGAPLPLAVVVTFLPHLYLGLAGAAFALWSVFPDRRALPAVIAAVVLVSGGLWGPSWRAAPETSRGEAVRVMTWNVRRLWGGPEDLGDPTRCVVGAVEASDPDVITLQEVTREDVGRLADALGLECVHADYRSTGDPRHGGLASCVRGGRWRLVQGGPQRYVDDDRWVYLLAELERNGHVFNHLAVHLYPYPFSAAKLRAGIGGLAQGDPDVLTRLGADGSRIVHAQSRQARALFERVERLRDPTVIAGDFNSTRDASLHVALRRYLSDAWERGGAGYGGTHRFLGWLPLRIDYVYVTRAFAVGGARVLEVGCSDHRPVVADLVLRS